MVYNWETCSSDIKDFVFALNRETVNILNGNVIGFYIHGSLAMGGFHPKSSDIDVLVVTNKSLSTETKRKLARSFLHCSNSPFPVEISFLNHEQLKNWRHPSPFDFHFSEFWRERYEKDLLMGTYNYLNGEVNTDADLAAHITITNHRGVCVEGKPIDQVFPLIPRQDYLLSIMGDFQDCLENIKADPVYCILNMLRVFWYLKEGVISSKQEAGEWGTMTLPQDMRSTINKVLNCYTNGKDCYHLEEEELLAVTYYVRDYVRKLLE